MFVAKTRPWRRKSAAIVLNLQKTTNVAKKVQQDKIHPSFTSNLPVALVSGMNADFHRANINIDETIE